MFLFLLYIPCEQLHFFSLGTLPDGTGMLNERVLDKRKFYWISCLDRPAGSGQCEGSGEQSQEPAAGVHACVEALRLEVHVQVRNQFLHNERFCFNYMTEIISDQNYYLLQYFITHRFKTLTVIARLINSGSNFVGSFL